MKAHKSQIGNYKHYKQTRQGRWIDTVQQTNWYTENKKYIMNPHIKKKIKKDFYKYMHIYIINTVKIALAPQPNWPSSTTENSSQQTHTHTHTHTHIKTHTHSVKSINQRNDQQLS